MKFDEIDFLEVEDVEELHARAIADHGGGADGLRDRGLLESAVKAPRSGYYGSLAEIAAVYAHGIAKNHPFVDGNKRTGLFAAAAFLGAYGFDLIAAPAEHWISVMLGVASGEIPRAELIRLFVANMAGGDVAIDEEDD